MSPEEIQNYTGYIPPPKTPAKTLIKKAERKVESVSLLKQVKNKIDWTTRNVGPVDDQTDKCGAT